MPRMVSRKQQTEPSDFEPGEFQHDIDLARRMHELVSDHPDFEVLCEPSLHIYYFRYLPHSFALHQEKPEVQELLDRLNQEIVEFVQRNGFTSVTTTSVGNRGAIQITICPRSTLADGIDATFEAIARWGRLLIKKFSVRYEGTSEMEVQLCSSESHSSPTEVSAT